MVQPEGRGDSAAEITGLLNFLRRVEGTRDTESAPYAAPARRAQESKHRHVATRLAELATGIDLERLGAVSNRQPAVRRKSQCVVDPGATASGPTETELTC